MWLLLRLLQINAHFSNQTMFWFCAYSLRFCFPWRLKRRRQIVSLKLVRITSVWRDHLLFVAEWGNPANEPSVRVLDTKVLFIISWEIVWSTYYWEISLLLLQLYMNHLSGISRKTGALILTLCLTLKTLHFISMRTPKRRTPLLLINVPFDSCYDVLLALFYVVSP